MRSFILIAGQVPYIVGEAPSNLLLKRASPSTWQSRIMVTWGIALLCHVPVTNKAGIWGTRFLLGLVSLPCRAEKLSHRLSLTRSSRPKQACFRE